MRPGSLARKSAMLLHWMLVCAFAAVLGTVAAPPAPAQSLSLVPAELRYVFKPGQPFQYNLSVSNDGPAPVLVRVNTTDLWYNEKNEKTFGTPGSSPRSAANWIEIVPRQLTVSAHGAGTMKVMVTPPSQVAGGYYAVVFVESKPQLMEAGAPERKAIYTNIRLGCLVLLRAENTEDYQIAVSDARLTPPETNRNLRLDFTLLNKGNTHVFPQARIAILDSHNELVAKAEAEEKRFFPGQKDSMSVTWGGTLALGNYTAILTLLYGNDKVYTQDFPFVVTESK
jgi:hypothetical protein